ncbi:MAG: hypothetical protein ACI80N_003985, partial [Gammaproteobacteria bacterium]
MKQAASLEGEAACSVDWVRAPAFVTGSGGQRASATLDVRVVNDVGVGVDVDV